MEEFKSLDQLTKIDPQYALINNEQLSLEEMHQLLARETLSDCVPNQIKDQFNITKNMALYSFFCYSLAIDVQLKTYSLIEYALKLKIQPKKPTMFKALLQHALNENWISDEGFRHMAKDNIENQGCKLMINQIPALRNIGNLGSHIQISHEDCIEHIAICCDFINQLFSPKTEGQFTNKFDANFHIN